MVSASLKACQPIFGGEDLLDFKPLFHPYIFALLYHVTMSGDTFAASSCIVLWLWILTPVCTKYINIYCIYIYNIYRIDCITSLLLPDLLSIHWSTKEYKDFLGCLSDWSGYWSWLCAQSTERSHWTPSLSQLIFYNFTGFVWRARSHDDNHASTRLVMTYGIMFH